MKVRDQLYVALKGDEEHCIDPLDIMILPNDLTLLPLDEDGHLRIGMWLNSSHFMNPSWIRVYPVGNDPIEIRNMKVETTLNKQFTYGGILLLQTLLLGTTI